METEHKCDALHKLTVSSLFLLINGSTQNNKNKVKPKLLFGILSTEPSIVLFVINK